MIRPSTCRAAGVPRGRRHAGHLWKTVAQPGRATRGRVGRRRPGTRVHRQRRDDDRFGLHLAQRNGRTLARRLSSPVAEPEYALGFIHHADRATQFMTMRWTASAANRRLPGLEVEIAFDSLEPLGRVARVLCSLTLPGSARLLGRAEIRRGPVDEHLGQLDPSSAPAWCPSDQAKGRLWRHRRAGRLRDARSHNDPAELSH